MMRYTLRPDDTPPGYCDQTEIIAHDQLLSWGGEVNLNPNCLYDFKDANLNSKLFNIRGKSYGYNPDDWSVRIGGRRKFRPATATTPAFTVPMNKFEISACLYDKNQRGFGPKVSTLFEVDPDESFTYFIDCDRKNDTVTFTSDKMNVPRVYKFLWNNVPLWGLQLFPYAFGDKPFPHFASMVVSDF